MTDYRAYVVDKDGHIKSAEVIVADYDEKPIEAGNPRHLRLPHTDRTRQRGRARARADAACPPAECRKI